jgi:hypothetical protein
VGRANILESGWTRGCDARIRPGARFHCLPARTREQASKSVCDARDNTGRIVPLHVGDTRAKINPQAAAFSPYCAICKAAADSRSARKPEASLNAGRAGKAATRPRCTSSSDLNVRDHASQRHIPRMRAPDIDAHALSSSPRGSAGRNRRPNCLVEQAEEAIWDKARPRCIDVAIALGTLVIATWSRRRSSSIEILLA